jgi:hypothetical protein
MDAAITLLAGVQGRTLAVSITSDMKGSTARPSHKALRYTELRQTAYATSGDR